jgi:hypothetical protein
MGDAFTYHVGLIVWLCLSTTHHPCHRDHPRTHLRLTKTNCRLANNVVPPHHHCVERHAHLYLFFRHVIFRKTELGNENSDRFRRLAIVTCPAGYKDITNGNANNWGCGEGCAGGLYTDGGCGCACQPMGCCDASCPCLRGSSDESACLCGTKFIRCIDYLVVWEGIGK